MGKQVVKPLEWVGSSRKDLLAMPDAVIDVMGYALHLAQIGLKHDQAKVLKGISTPKHEMDLVDARLKLARLHAEGVEK